MRISILLFGIGLISCNNHSEKIHTSDSVSKNIFKPYNTPTPSSLSNSRTSLLSHWNRRLIMVSSAQSSPSDSVIINGCKFDIVTNGQDTTFLSTSDERFRTPEGYKIGMTLSQLPKQLQRALSYEFGWAYYLKLSSGWSLGFCEGSSCTDHYPRSDSKVKWVFK